MAFSIAQDIWLAMVRSNCKPLDRLSRLSHILCGLFRRGGINKKCSPPFETGHFGQFRGDLNMPMVAVFVPTRKGGVMDDEIIWWIFEHEVKPPKDILQYLSCPFIGEGPAEGVHIS